MTPIKWFAAAAIVCLPGCSTLSLEQVDYGWPVESVLTVSQSNVIEDVRYGLRTGVGAVAQEEFQDSTALRGARLRLLRSTEGYYFLTGPRFKHVYVFAAGPSTLVLNKAIPVADAGLKSPAFNQRPPYVELIDGDTFRRLLSSDDIVEVKK